MHLPLPTNAGNHGALVFLPDSSEDADQVGGSRMSHPFDPFFDLVFSIRVEIRGEEIQRHGLKAETVRDL